MDKTGARGQSTPTSSESSWVPTEYHQATVSNCKTHEKTIHDESEPAETMHAKLDEKISSSFE